MKGLKEQVWVTSAVTDDDVEKALILCYSLKRAYTSRKIAVIASQKLSSNMRQALNHGFDFIFHLDEDQNTAQLKLEDFAKLYSLLALKSFDNCAFVSPYMLALRNCDDIFSKETNGLVMMPKDDQASIFLFKPSINNYMALAAILMSSGRINGFGIGTYLKRWMKTQFKKTETLDEKYNNVFTRDKAVVDFEHNIFMANLMEYSKQSDIDDLRKTGILGNLIGIHWLKIQKDDVLPLIQQSNPNSNSTQPLQYRKEPIAIVGMSCRYPESNNLEEFWNLLFQGEDGTSNPPPFRWLREECCRYTADSKKMNAGFLNVPVDEFDAKFFGISPKEVLFMDPQHRLLHELVWEGLEDACIDPQTLRGTSGSVFMGSWMNDYKDILVQSGNAEFYRVYMGNSIGAATARLSFLLGLTGPSIATESGCSSAMVAVHMACGALQNGETNLAVAGGVNLLLNPFDKDSMPMVLSPDGHCKTFSEDANGFARAEGCGVLILKRLSDALKDGDNIWALIRGSAVAQEGVSNSMGTPTVHCESLAMEEALKDARVQPEEVSYVESHGTGTIVGDPMEITAIAKAYYSPERKNPLVIGSVKTNVGHTESCSGITGIMKVVLGMHHEAIPAHQNLTKVNPSINLEAIPAVIPMENMEWKKCKGIPRIAGVSSFGITGTDAHAIIEEAPEIPLNKVLSVNNSSDRPVQLLKISAKTDEALEILLDKYRAKMTEGEEKLSDIAFTSNSGRANFPCRAAIIARTRDEAVSCIEKGKYWREEVSVESQGKICFLFTGQGSQYPGMAKRLYESSPVFQMHFDYCDKILQKDYNITLKEVLWSSNASSGEEISRTIYSQTSIFCVEYALLKLWESWGVTPNYTLGHSLGEFAAAVCAGIISVDDAIKLVAHRSILIDDLPQGKMLVIQADYIEVQKKMKQFAGKDNNKMLDYAAINSSSQTVVAGDSDTVMKFSIFCTESKLKCTVLAATHAFHSKHMDAILEKYREIAELPKMTQVKKCEYISGMRGDLVPTKGVNAEYWVQHTREKVNFLNASKKAVELGCKIFIEIGPQPVLSALTMMNNDDNLLFLPSLKRREDEWETILNSAGRLYVKGIEIDWAGFDQFYNRRKVRLPHYPFIGKKFWPDLMQVNGNAIHPLIGSVLPNASSVKIFQNGVNLTTHSYLKDHAIGQTVVFPGAGYLEMCLAAGLATVEGSTDSLCKPSRPMKLENLMIKAPLALQDEKTCKLQTVVELNRLSTNQSDWNDMAVKIFHRQDTDISESWLEHAAATFSPLPSAEELIMPFNVKVFQETLLQPSNDEAISQIYDKLASLGLKFGPLFRSLEKVWKSEESLSLLAKVKEPENTDGQVDGYIIHPVTLDAMIQAIMMHKLTSNAKAKLYVPIKIGKFLWMSNPTSESSNDLYIHVYDNTYGDSSLSTSSCSALLVDLNGKVLALMTDVEFIDTTVKAVEAVLEQQTSTMPDLWEECWRPSVGPLQHRHDLALCRKERFYDEKFLNDLKREYNELKPHQHEAFMNLDRLVYLNFLRCLYDCGWVPTLDATFTEESLIESFGIQKEFIKMFSFILHVLEEEGTLQNMGLANWKVIAVTPSATEIQEELSSSIFTVDLVKTFSSTLLLSELGKHYSGVFKGTQSVLPIMFPEDPSKSKWPPVADFYTDYGKLAGMTNMYVEVGRAESNHCKGHISGQRNIFRILEVGAGTGIFTNAYLQVLHQNDVEVEYTFTDISPAFFPTAEKTLQAYLKSMTFKKLNIEEDPISQGFIPNYYDHIIASDVIHATKNLSETLGHIRTLLRPNGKFVMCEQTRKSRILTYLFGLLEGFWRFDDVDLRPDHCTLSTEKWKEILHLSGFDVLEAFPSVNNYHSLIYSVKTENGVLTSNSKLLKSNDLQKYWILFHLDNSPTSQFLLEEIPDAANRNVIIVRRGDEFQSQKSGNGWIFKVKPDSEQDFVELMDSIDIYCGRNIEGVIYAWSLDKTCTTQDSILQPYFYMTKSFMRKKQSASAKIICLVNGIMPIEGNDFTHFHSSTLWGFTKALKNERSDIQSRCIDIGGKDDVTGAEEVFYELWSNDKDTQVGYLNKTKYKFKLQALKPVISDLKIPNGSDRFKLILPETKSISDLQFDTLEPFCLDKNEVEVQIKASALNFRDVFSVLKPTEQFKDINAVGFDFAGIVKRIGSHVSQWSVGDRVFGLNINGDPLPSHVKLDEMDLLAVPDDITLNDACTLPAVVATSYHCLMEVAKVKSADIVLIHAASGGVGLSAIEICKNVGATVIATAGSKRKQNYLRSLGIKHVFHSRNTDYCDEILKVTNGRGVNVILNSLTSEGFKEATLKACAKNARFVEMSKLSIWQPEEVRELRPDVMYSIVDLSSMDKHEIRRLMTAINDLATKKSVTPIPYVRFDAVQIREALQYLQKAKHIGKVVCVMPEFKMGNSKSEVYTPMFSENATYLITGGLGGIGFVVCQWMIERGANHIILAGRSLPSEKLTKSINCMRKENEVKIIPVQLDVSNLEECKELIQVKIGQTGLPPLKGIMHAAGTLQDGLIENQTWKKLSSTFKTKVVGTLNLHELTKDLNLEHFVMFSSMAATVGSPGQCNHAAGNTFEDTFAHYRNSIGLPATTVNWGQWGEVGIATEVDLPGVKALSNLQGVTGLEFAMKSQRTQTGIFNIESFVLLSKLCPQILHILDERVWKTKGKDNSSGDFRMKSDEFWQQYDILDCAEAKAEIISEKLRIMLRNILKLDEADVIEDNTNFQEMGVDSLMFVEMKNAIQALFGNRVTVNVSAVKDCNTVSLLADALIKIIEGESVEEEKLPNTEEVSALIKEDCQLPEHIMAKPGQLKVCIKEVSRILLTGCSGTLGPYILKELSNTPQVTEIICLMRSSKAISEKERLKKILQDRDLLSQVDMSKVRCVTGNVALSNIGMESHDWDELSNSVDAVFHCAASVQHMEHYRKRVSDKDMRAVNVGGTKNILTFACYGSKLKHVFCASSLLAVAALGEDNRFSEDWPSVTDFDGVTTIAYPITKFVGDVLLKQAILEREIPGKVFRFPLIVGDSQTGRFVLDQNHAMLRYMFILQQGMMPSNPLPLVMLPVDVCAWASVKIFFDSKAPDDIFNVSNITPAPEQEFVSVAEKLGYKVDVVEFSEFSKKIRESTPDDSPFAIFKDFYQNDEDILSLYNTLPSLKQYILDGGSDENFLVSKKIASLLPEFYNNIGSCMDHIYRDMLFARSQGWFAKFNL